MKRYLGSTVYIHNPEILISILKETIKFLKIEVKE